MEPAEEIRSVVIRFFEALRDGDEEAVSNRISRQPGFERFGTDAVEWWQDGDAAARVWIQVMRETDGYPWRLVGDVHAMSEGSVGWAGGRAEFDASEGPVELRFTCVLHLEHGEWKLVQWHGGYVSGIRRTRSDLDRSRVATGTTRCPRGPARSRHRPRPPA